MSLSGLGKQGEADGEIAHGDSLGATTDLHPLAAKQLLPQSPFRHVNLRFNKMKTCG